jgi:hypothetical protein
VIRAVIDTNVLVSGLLSPTGNEALILLAIHQGLVHPCRARVAEIWVSAGFAHIPEPQDPDGVTEALPPHRPIA